MIAIVVESLEALLLTHSRWKVVQLMHSMISIGASC